ncbi:MAG: Gfo/Idh/MocA family oxidoreductase, partial [Deltaproteobacteria bacterium]|nr:Gfo/Idh/MocA family oxidoreductase [Deltaproteobacteria bacterium]
TLGAIAMQGVRQADMRLGETCAVIGLGLLGQLTGVLLRASGIRVIGVDVNQAVVNIARKYCSDLALSRDTSGIKERIMEYTGGLGCDAVIITAATDSLDPVNFAGAVSRKKGVVVVVGAVPTGFDREPHYYKKELALKMSCSYGPGRYDPVYEELGVDYPASYVRWTEKRNMEAFQDLIASKKIDISYLTTHTFKLQDAHNAYEMVLNKTELFLGILIEYDTGKPISKNKIEKNIAQGTGRDANGVTIGFIGAGSYAQSYLLPNITKNENICLKGVMTSSSTGSRSVADRYGFEFCTGNAADIFSNPEINTVFIASRHDSHGKYVIESLKNGKNVFVEKPLCLSPDELQEIQDIYDTQLTTNTPPILMVGYNRRFSPLTNYIKKTLVSGPMAMIYRINAGYIPADSWIQIPEIGGGRIIGEVCHFVDYLTHMSGSLPKSVFAAVMDDPKNLNDILHIVLKYENGASGSIIYLANGAKSLEKEYIEIYQSGITSVIHDFRGSLVYGDKKTDRKKLMSQDKGQKNEVMLFLKALNTASESPIPVKEILNTSEVCFKIIESIRTGKTIHL